LSFLIAAPAYPITRLLEPGLILPALSVLLFAEAAIAAILACLIHARRDSEDATLWDIAGALTMMGCAATIFSEPDQIAGFCENLTEQHSDTQWEIITGPGSSGDQRAAMSQCNSVGLAPF
jgi:hypothetical protein